MVFLFSFRSCALFAVFQDNIEGGMDVPKRFSFPSVGVMRLSLPAEGEGLSLQVSFQGSTQFSRTGTGDGCVFLLEPRRLRLTAHEKQK